MPRVVHFIVVIAVAVIGFYLFKTNDNKTLTQTFVGPNTGLSSKEKPLSELPPTVINYQGKTVTINDNQIIVNDKNLETGYNFPVKKKKTVYPANFPEFPDKGDLPPKAWFDETFREYSWSHNSKKLAFIDIYDGKTQQIAILDLSAKLFKVVTKSTHPLISKPVWSPDDSRLLYYELDGYGTGAGYGAEVKVISLINAEEKSLGGYGAPSNLIWIDNNYISFKESDVNGSRVVKLSIN